MPRPDQPVLKHSGGLWDCVNKGLICSADLTPSFQLKEDFDPNLPPPSPTNWGRDFQILSAHLSIRALVNDDDNDNDGYSPQDPRALATVPAPLSPPPPLAQAPTPPRPQTPPRPALKAVRAAAANRMSLELKLLKDELRTEEDAHAFSRGLIQRAKNVLEDCDV